jgi:hypothetical protein
MWWAYSVGNVQLHAVFHLEPLADGLPRLGQQVACWPHATNDNSCRVLVMNTLAFFLL